MRVKSTQQTVSWSVVLLGALLVIRCHAKTEIGDYIVDCSACNYPPIEGAVESYQCSVRCEVTGKIVQPVILLLFHPVTTVVIKVQIEK